MAAAAQLVAPRHPEQLFSTAWGEGVLNKQLAGFSPTSHTAAQESHNS